MAWDLQNIASLLTDLPKVLTMTAFLLGHKVPCAIEVEAPSRKVASSSKEIEAFSLLSSQALF